MSSNSFNRKVTKFNINWTKQPNNFEQRNERPEYKYDTSEKDILIGQLKAHIFEIEQNEKNFLKLNLRFKELQNQ